MDEADFRQAIRLLHITQAWIGPQVAADSPVRKDPLYPMQHESQRQRPLLGAISELLVKYPYELDTHVPNSHSGPESDAPSQPSAHPRVQS